MWNILSKFGEYNINSNGVLLNTGITSPNCCLLQPFYLRAQGGIDAPGSSLIRLIGSKELNTTDLICEVIANTFT